MSAELALMIAGGLVALGIIGWLGVAAFMRICQPVEFDDDLARAETSEERARRAGL